MRTTTTSSLPPHEIEESHQTEALSAVARAGSGPQGSPPRAELNRVALGLGGNLGDTEAALKLAIARLAAALGPLEIAALYRSSPVSPIPQPAFLNTAVLAHTALAPEEVLAIAKQIEFAAHRRRRERWGPRELDIDLLLFGDQQRHQPELMLPHPQLRQRRFVLAPLADLAPDWPIPPDGAHVAQLLAQAPLSDTVERIPWSR